MCGRFTLITNAQLISKILQLNRTPTLQPRYNIAPTQPVAAVRQRTGSEERELEFLRWGLIPSWAKDSKIGSRLINAKSETVFEKPAFRSAIRRRRCLIPADGFFEWKREGKQKQPFYIHMRDENPFVFAGLWECWKDAEGVETESCSILTTQANALMRPLHDRMPVIIHPNDYGCWLDTTVQDKETLQFLFQPYMKEQMIAVPVGSLVNSAANDCPACIEPANVQMDLF
ncbi:MAG: SOS response-associated peptidase [Candidatus Omnitrophota bacterium]|jgi:putative SOS response-associated peptidase YedK|nr:MAG: SOS response-associated peptidase [Candidatus Omnitrophota bacterium]